MFNVALLIFVVSFRLLQLASSTNHGADTAEHVLCSEKESKEALRELFTKLDRDGDGQIRESEASMYIKTQTGQELKVVQAEAEQLMASLDGSDTDDTISIEELEKNLDLRGEVITSHLLVCVCPSVPLNARASGVNLQPPFFSDRRFH